MLALTVAVHTMYETFAAATSCLGTVAEKDPVALPAAWLLMTS